MGWGCWWRIVQYGSCAAWLFLGGWGGGGVGVRLTSAKTASFDHCVDCFLFITEGWSIIWIHWTSWEFRGFFFSSMDSVYLPPPAWRCTTAHFPAKCVSACARFIFGKKQNKTDDDLTKNVLHWHSKFSGDCLGRCSWRMQVFGLFLTQLKMCHWKTLWEETEAERAFLHDKSSPCLGLNTVCSNLLISCPLPLDPDKKNPRERQRFRRTQVFLFFFPFSFSFIFFFFFFCNLDNLLPACSFFF